VDTRPALPLPPFCCGGRRFALYSRVHRMKCGWWDACVVQIFVGPCPSPHRSTWDRGFPPQILLRISRSVGIPLEEEHVTHPRDRRGARGATSIEPIPQRTFSFAFAPLRTTAPAPGRIVLDMHRIPKGVVSTGVSFLLSDSEQVASRIFLPIVPGSLDRDDGIRPRRIAVSCAPTHVLEKEERRTVSDPKGTSRWCQASGVEVEVERQRGNWTRRRRRRWPSWGRGLRLFLVPKACLKSHKQVGGRVDTCRAAPWQADDRRIQPFEDARRKLSRHPVLSRRDVARSSCGLLWNDGARARNCAIEDGTAVRKFSSGRSIPEQHFETVRVGTQELLSQDCRRDEERIGERRRSGNHADHVATRRGDRHTFRMLTTGAFPQSSHERQEVWQSLPCCGKDGFQGCHGSWPGRRRTRPVHLPSGLPSTRAV